MAKGCPRGLRLACVSATVVAAWGAGACATGGSEAGPAAATVIVSAAVSLTDVLTPLAGDFERRTGVDVRLNLGPSNTLARQIVEGAPADVFVSADERQMQVVERAGLVVAGSRVIVAGNRLVIVVPVEQARAMASPRDLLDPAIRRIAVGEPSAVPAGVYARAYLEAMDLWRALEPRLVPVASVRGALAAVEAGNVDAGIVYRTDARAGRVAVAFEAPAGLSPRIVYPAAVVTTGTGREAGRRFLAYLAGPDGRRAFEEAGFLLADAGS